MLKVMFSLSVGALSVELLGGNYVVNAENHDGCLGGCLDFLGADAQGLDDVVVEHVLDAALIDVDACCGLALLVGAAQVQEDAKLIQARVLSEGAGDDFEGVSVCLNG